MHSWNVQRAVAMVLLLALIPVGVIASASVSLVLLTSVLVALVSYEALHFAAGRRALRRTDH
jgi:hypothetical protein